MTPEDVALQAEALTAYLRKPGNRGATFWFDSKGFAPRDRTAILITLGDSDVSWLVRRRA